MLTCWGPFCNSSIGQVEVRRMGSSRSDLAKKRKQNFPMWHYRQSRLSDRLGGSVRIQGWCRNGREISFRFPAGPTTSWEAYLNLASLSWFPMHCIPNRQGFIIFFPVTIIVLYLLKGAQKEHIPFNLYEPNSGPWGSVLEQSKF